MTEACQGCGGIYDFYEGPTHAYMTSSPACWHRYGQILAYEYSDKNLFDAAHRLTVDAYALQHPGDINDRRANQSVHLHYVSLFLIFEKNMSHELATQSLGKLAKSEFPNRPRAPAFYTFTASDFDYSTPLSHHDHAFKWAKSTYEVWSELKPYAQDRVKGLGY